MFALLFRDDRTRQVVALCKQLLVVQRRLGKRPSLVPRAGPDEAGRTTRVHFPGGLVWLSRWSAPARLPCIGNGECIGAGRRE